MEDGEENVDCGFGGGEEVGFARGICGVGHGEGGLRGGGEEVRRQIRKRFGVEFS